MDIILCDHLGQKLCFVAVVVVVVVVFVGVGSEIQPFPTVADRAGYTQSVFYLLMQSIEMRRTQG